MITCIVSSFRDCSSPMMQICLSGPSQERKIHPLTKNGNVSIDITLFANDSLSPLSTTLAVSAKKIPIHVKKRPNTDNPIAFAHLLCNPLPQVDVKSHMS